VCWRGPTRALGRNHWRQIEQGLFRGAGIGNYDDDCSGGCTRPFTVIVVHSRRGIGSAICVSVLSASHLEEQPPGTFLICPVCWWEDDDAQFRRPDLVGGANGVSLEQARRNYSECGISDPAARRYQRNATDIIFTYWLVGSGWALGNIADGRRGYKMIPTYLSDALGDLIHAVNCVFDTAMRNVPGRMNLESGYGRSFAATIDSTFRSADFGNGTWENPSIPMGRPGPEISKEWHSKQSVTSAGSLLRSSGPLPASFHNIPSASTKRSGIMPSHRAGLRISGHGFIRTGVKHYCSWVGPTRTRSLTSQSAPLGNF